MITTIEIRQHTANNTLRYTKHMLLRMIQREISIKEIKTILRGSTIIEQYPDDNPYPSCLVSGRTESGRQLHIVCGKGDDELWLITTYQPALTKWLDDNKSREE